MIKSAEFVMSNTRVTGCPDSREPEYAFIGRSNVGKSSLINCLTGNSKLAKASSTPGKTLLINHFLINKSWYIVDLPGYGYATISKTEREKLRKMIDDYILYRRQLTNVFVLLDARLSPQKIDMEFMQWLGENEVPFSMVFTKCDKLGKQALQRNIELYKSRMLEIWEELPPCFLTSSTTGMGREQLIEYIESINDTYVSENSL